MSYTIPVHIAFKLTHPNAKLPQEKRPGDVGFDVSAVEKTVIPAGATSLVKTGLQLADMPTRINGVGAFLKVEGRSGMALKGIFPVGGIIDPTYRGEIGIILHNSSDKKYEIAEGDRIAQLLVYMVNASPFIKMEEAQSITDSVRGSDGFGSSGK